MFWVETVEQFI